MNGLCAEKLDVAPLQLFNCTHADCGATFTREWRLEEHQTVHTGAKPVQCKVEGCGRRFSRKSHLSRHALRHPGVKQFRCTFVSCTKSFFNADNLKRHIRYAHGEKDKYFKCKFANCSLSFKKRRAYKLHLKVHGTSHNFKCSKEGCMFRFDSHVTRKAHEKTHAGYRCPQENCQMIVNTWGKLQKHMAKHPGEHVQAHDPPRPRRQPTEAEEPALQEGLAEASGRPPPAPPGDGGPTASLHPAHAHLQTGQGGGRPLGPLQRTQDPTLRRPRGQSAGPLQHQTPSTWGTPCCSAQGLKVKVS
ncbi:P43 5S RNA-binding protein-like isoform X3 [Osmerus mordax]|uniref:P43 5S RNA-binding protein-like isoform X3 n=1 Tax=Osmerus mordax TaxID=8014 RepID=UPI00350FE491